MAEEDTQAGMELPSEALLPAEVTQSGDAPAVESPCPQPTAQASLAPQASSGQSIAERRHAQRYIAHWRAALVSVNDGDTRYLGATENICATGVAIACEAHVPPQKDYHVYLEIPQSVGKTAIVLQLDGRVVHTTLSRQVFKVGVAFKKFHGDSEKILKSILASGKLKQIINPDY